MKYFPGNFIKTKILQTIIMYNDEHMFLSVGQNSLTKLIKIVCKLFSSFLSKDSTSIYVKQKYLYISLHSYIL